MSKQVVARVRVQEREIVQPFGAGPLLAEVRAVDEHGLALLGLSGWSTEVWCPSLESVPTLSVGDQVLVVPLQPLPSATKATTAAVVVGRLKQAGHPPKTLELAAAERVTIRCGDASIDLRADGKVLIKGDDVTVHAKGTQRIRAGNVAIN
jgi:hypothetical protein